MDVKEEFLMSLDRVIEHYKKDVDLAAIRENLKLSTQERSEKFQRMMRLIFELRRNASSAKGDQSDR